MSPWAILCDGAGKSLRNEIVGGLGKSYSAIRSPILPLCVAAMKAAARMLESARAAAAICRQRQAPAEGQESSVQRRALSGASRSRSGRLPAPTAAQRSPKTPEAPLFAGAGRAFGAEETRGSVSFAPPNQSQNLQHPQGRARGAECFWVRKNADDRGSARNRARTELSGPCDDSSTNAFAAASSRRSGLVRLVARTNTARETVRSLLARRRSPTPDGRSIPHAVAKVILPSGGKDETA